MKLRYNPSKYIEHKMGNYKLSKKKLINLYPKCIPEFNTKIPLYKVKPSSYLIKQLRLKWKEGQKIKDCTTGQIDDHCNFVDIFYDKIKNERMRIIYYTFPSIPIQGKRLTLHQKIQPPITDILVSSHSPRLHYIGIKLGVWVHRTINILPRSLVNDMDVYCYLLNALFRNGLYCFASSRPKEKIVAAYLNLLNKINIKKVVRMSINAKPRPREIQCLIYTGYNTKPFRTIFNPKNNKIEKKKYFDIYFWWY